MLFYLNKLLNLCNVSKTLKYLYKELKMCFCLILKADPGDEAVMLSLPSGHNDVANEVKCLKRKYNMQLEWVMN